ncbi:MAG: HAMP domain-containing protein [Cytophagales bacterium]|nr:MAG: HAMP domain-containing protein [Cytophagales bacterium]
MKWNLKIRTKLLFSFSILILFTLVVGLSAYFYSSSITQHQKLKEKIDLLLITTLQMRKQQQDFLIQDTKSLTFMRTGESNNLNQFQQNTTKVRQLTEEIKTSPIISNLELNKNIERVQKLHKQYAQLFPYLAEKMLLRGFKDYGLEGQMRISIHELENLADIDPTLVLLLRRHEKDFFLRKDPIYAEKLHEVALQIRAEYAKNKLIQEKIENYERVFNKIVAIENEIGFTNSLGSQGQLQKNTQEIDTELNDIQYLVEQEIDAIINRTIFIIASIVAFVFIIALITAFYFSYAIATPIITLDRIAQSVVKDFKGQEKILDSIRSKDEIGNLARSFKTMLIDLKQKMQQAKDRSDKLEEFARTESQRNWHNEGLTLFNEILRNQQWSLEQQSLEIISQLVRYTKSNQGGIFIVNKEAENDIHLELKACYAYDRQKYLKKRINIGDGLVGTAWLEQDTLIITDVPQDYVHITSGLGEARPNCVLVVPIKHETNVEGVIELVSFKEFSRFEIDFIESLSQKIGTAILSIQYNESMKKLLTESKYVAEQAQEKERKLYKQLENYENWVVQFEKKLAKAQQTTLMYQSIISKLYDGIVLINENLQIVQISPYIYEQYKIEPKQTEGKRIEIKIDAEYDNLLDLKAKKLRINYYSFRQSVLGKVNDVDGNSHEVEMMVGRIEVEKHTMYVILFNDLAEESQKVIEIYPQEKVKIFQSTFG